MNIRSVLPSLPATVVVGKNQYAYLYQGHGQRPLRIDLRSGDWADSGIDAPDTAPQTAVGTDVKYYVARCDVVATGTQYTLPPSLSFTGACERPAVARCFLTGDGLSSVDMVDNGRGYLAPPDIALAGATGSGAVLEVVLDTGTASPGTIATASVIRNADYTPCLAPINYDGVPLTAAGVPVPGWTFTDTSGNIWSFARKTGDKLTYAVELVKSFGAATATQTRNAKIEVSFATTLTVGGRLYPVTLSAAGIRIVDAGAGYDSTKPFVLAVDATARGANGVPDVSRCGGAGTQQLVVEFYTADNANSPANTLTDGAYRRIKSVTITSGGSGYTGSPQLTVASSDGQGAILRAETDGGAIVNVSVLAAGLYTTPPSVTVGSGGGAVVPIARAHLRGLYQCCYRWVDDTPSDRGGPICSSISPINEADCGDGSGSLTWTVPSPPVVDGRVLKLELWRSTANQAYTLYRLPESALVYDDFTDAELTDPNRENYLAMPILLPNGELNASRFGVPPSDKSVACMFQDRLWIAGDTSGSEPNTLYYSEVDEPESMPEVNDLNIQTNVKSHDHITALIPYGGSLGVMQAHHAYRLSYVTQPLIDANVQIAAFRGCLNQRCWDEYEGIIYAMDTDGVYGMDQGGQVQSISDVITDFFTGSIDFANSKWFSVVADKNLNILRVSVRLATDEPGEYPTRQFCYSFLLKSWWEERYPNPLVGGCNLTDASGYYRTFYGAADGKVYAVGYGDRDMAKDTIVEATITDPGSGYVVPPKVTVSGGAGAVVASALDGEGGVLGLLVRCGGYGYENPVIAIDPPPDGRQATATCTTSSGPVDIPCWIKTGNMEYPSDSLAPGGRVDKNRSVSVLFTPTNGPSPLKLRMYYNNKPYPRSNAVHRDRGDGAIYAERLPSVAIDMDAGLQPENISSGVCRAIFDGHTMADIRGNDRHVAVELEATRSTAGPVTIHQLDVFGIPNPNGGG
jgi:hypothetical protein